MAQSMSFQNLLGRVNDLADVGHIPFKSLFTRIGLLCGNRTGQLISCIVDKVVLGGEKGFKSPVHNKHPLS